MNTTQYQSSSTHYDTAFNKIEGLTWLPWVGQDYSDRLKNQRLLVVGESHYYQNDMPGQTREAWLNDRLSTRDVVSQCLINCEFSTPTLKKIPKLLLNSAEVDNLRLWRDSAYYNFVQRPMDFQVKERPKPVDFVSGWKVFSEVVKIVQPSHCLFIGVSAANFYNLGVASRHEKVAGVWPRVANLEMSGIATKLIFVHHLSRSKKLNLWNDYLQSYHADFMKWLRAETYSNNQKP